ncbi:MAG: hypothetical protein A2Z18_07340 [Armatimonadetes bacterium RBG_16_58_9]|nr:MAG: hypothetical protein A2Z18_07340 [Armatimonadetes bacterium RBG_16_58_9]
MAVERQPNTGEIEDVICRLKDVIAVSAVADAAGQLQEIHVLTGSSRSPKQVVRDVESALMARLHVSVDHKIISIAQVDDGSARYDQTRLKFSDVSISLNGTGTEFTVRLSKDSQTYAGTATGFSSRSAQMKCIATATLRAIEDCGRNGVQLTLDDVSEVSVGDRKVALVLVSMVGDRGDDVLTGSAVIKQDLWKGVVNATLDAVNRRLCAIRDS